MLTNKENKDKENVKTVTLKTTVELHSAMKGYCSANNIKLMAELERIYEEAVEEYLKDKGVL